MRTTAGAATALILIVCGSSLGRADVMPGRPGPGYVPFSWTGFYIGANGGFAWNYDGNGDFILSNNFGTTVTTRGLQPEGGFGGGQLGYNWQQGSLLLGIEADLQGGGLSGDFSGRVLDPAGDLLNARQRVDYFGTVRGRVGLAFYHGLIYATGGFAYGGVRDQLFVHNPSIGVSANLSSDDTRTGFVVGGGVELALAPHWSVKVEYQKIDLGSQALTGPTLPPSAVTITSNKIQDLVDTIRIGFNYRFEMDFVPSK